MRLYLNGELNDIYESHPDWSALCDLVHAEFGPAALRIKEKAKKMGFDFTFSAAWPRLEIHDRYAYLDWKYKSLARKLNHEGRSTDDDKRRD